MLRLVRAIVRLGVKTVTETVREARRALDEAARAIEEPEVRVRRETRSFEEEPA